MPRNIFACLIEEHQQIQAILDTLLANSSEPSGIRTAHFNRFKKVFYLHEKFEEEVLFPAIKNNLHAKDLLIPAYAEHCLIDSVIGELEGLPYDERIWQDKLTLLKHSLLCHIREEELQLFPKITGILSENFQEKLVVELEQRTKIDNKLNSQLERMEEIAS